MKTEERIALALGCGFHAVSYLRTEDIPTEPSFRKFCEENSCGNYNANYACPPYCGSPEEMRAKIDRYKNAIVLKSYYPGQNAMDGELTKALKKKHTEMTFSLVSEIEKARGEKEDFNLIMSGPCGICSPCKCSSGEPCPAPEKHFSCLSAYCVDASKLAEKAGMPLSWSTDSVSLLSVYLY
ncbi:MAG: DUF2284 domain-containing protein [Oscillospiraceae bacterium]|nr:DUF2284 domain-containing protein [Oscillospiraceae bacterium]